MQNVITYVLILASNFMSIGTLHKDKAEQEDTDRARRENVSQILGKLGECPVFGGNQKVKNAAKSALQLNW